MNRSRLFLASLVLCAASSFPSSAADLLDAFEAARQSDPELLAAEAALAAGREKRVQGDALLLPRVNLEASMMRIDNESSTGLPSTFADLIKSESSGTVRETEVQFMQSLYDAGAWADRRQLQDQAELALIHYAQARQELIERVGETYLSLLLAQESLRVTQAEKASMQFHRDRAQARFDVGRGKVTDVQEAQSRFDAVVAREIAATGTLAVRESQYVELTGLDARTLAGLRPDLVLDPPHPASVQVWQARALAHSPQVLIRERELAIASAEVDKYRLTARPTLDLVASYDWKGQDGGLSPAISADRSQTGVVGLKLSVPLYAGGAIESRQREAAAKERQSTQELAAAQRDARLRTQNAFLDVQTGIARVHSLEQSERSNHIALEATLLGRELGARTELDVLDAQQRVFAAQLDLAQGRHDVLLGQLHLAAATGQLGEADLRAVNAALETAAR